MTINQNATSSVHLKNEVEHALEHTIQGFQASPLLQTILDCAVDAIFVKDCEGRFLLFNRAAAVIFGRSAEEAVGNKVTDLLGEDASDKIRKLELYVIETGNSSAIEETVAADGTVRTLLTTRSPYKDEHGQVIGLIGISRDITEKVLVEEELRKSQQRWRFALDGSGDGVWDWDMKTGHVYYSRQWKAMLGYGKDELGDTVSEWSDRVHPDDMPRCWETINNHFRGSTPDFVLEHRMRAKDGSWRWILDRGKVIERAEDGTPQRTIGTHTDVTERKNAEVDLYLERERLALATESSHLGVWDYNLDANTMLCDPCWYEIFGLDPSSSVATIEAFNACLHPDDLERVTRERLTALANKEKIHRIEFRIQTPAGETRWIVSSARFLQANERTPNRLVGVVRDTTDRRIAEETLKSSYEALLQAERLARIGSWMLDLSTSRLVCSDMLNEMNGLGPDDPPLTPDRLRDLLPPEGYEKVRSGIERCIASGLPYEVETAHGRTDGTTYFAHIRGKANQDASGKTISVTGTVQDISEREEARARLAALADNLPNGAIYRLENTAAGEFALTYISGGIFTFIGIQAAEIIADQKLFVQAINGEDLPRYQEALALSFATRALFDCQFRAKTRAGETIWMHSRSAPRFQADGTTVWDGIMRDITEERQAAEILEQARDAAEAAEHAKSDFLATMSHEIRTPMNTVLGMTRLALQTELAPRQKNYLEKINTAANTLISIINDVLDFSKIEAGKLDLEETEFTLESVLESVAAVTAMRAEEKGLEIVYAVAPDVPERLVGDSLRLGQVLINLVNNAVKFTDHGEVVVTIDRVPQSRISAAMLQFAVRDTGIGLDSNQISGLFRAFSQADRDISRKYGGTGLGLAICKQLVERMGGMIWAISEPGKGSTFFFTMRAALPIAPQSNRATTRQTNLKGRRVLIVDDNASAREILSQMVGHFGMQVEVVDSGASALKSLKLASQEQKPFELVLMDWRMPDMDGLDAAQRIRADKNLRETPAVLMVTAYGREEVLRRSEALGLQGVLIKPVTESVMFNTIIDVLDHPHRINQDDLITAPDEKPPTVETHAPFKEKWLEQLNRRRVLVVDDNALNREVVSDFLILAGVEVETASDGVDALSMLETADYEAVLMDVHMPVMDGLSAAREIRRHDRWSKLPIIALTAQARTEDRQASLAAGMNAHLTKPIDEMELYRTLCDLLPHIPNSIGEHSISDGTALHQQAIEPVQADDPLPRLDLSAALARLGNNQERLSRLLHGFVRDFAAAPVKLAKEHENGRLEEVAALAHAVKGAASYLDANDLCESAESLEQAARRLDSNAVNEQVPVFRRHLEAVLRHLKVLTQAAVSTGVSIVEVDIPMVLDLLTQTEPLLAKGDYAAQPLLQDICVRVAGTTAATLAEEIRSHFDELELEAAISALQRLKEALNPHGKGAALSL